MNSEGILLEYLYPWFYSVRVAKAKPNTYYTDLTSLFFTLRAGAGWEGIDSGMDSRV